jgi:hypothetical protein
VISPTTLSEALSKAASSPEFGSDAWLTFYLCGDPSNLTSLADELAALGGRNLEGAEEGFLYAKLPVRLDAADIQRAAGETSALAEQHKVIVDHIDLDSSPAVGSSKFFSLIKGRR